MPPEPALFDVEPTRSAVLSLCGTYRYELRRTWGTGETVGWVMLNPSTADAHCWRRPAQTCIASR